MNRTQALENFYVYGWRNPLSHLKHHFGMANPSKENMLIGAHYRDRVMVFADIFVRIAGGQISIAICKDKFHEILGTGINPKYKILKMDLQEFLNCLSKTSTNEESETTMVDWIRNLAKNKGVSEEAFGIKAMLEKLSWGFPFWRREP